MRKSRKKKVNVLRTGLLMLLFSVVILLLAQVPKLYKNLKNNAQKEAGSTIKEDNQEVKDESARWSKYENEDYSISFDYPYLMHKIEYEDPGEYDYFVVFEENQFSKEKGVAFGVSSDGLEKEIERIKDNVSKQGGSILIKDEEFEESCLDSWVLEYEPEDESMEKRSFFIFERGDYTFSFSTVPEQIQRLRKSIGFSN